MLIELIEEVRHARCVTGSRSRLDISGAVSRKRADQFRGRLAAAASILEVLNQHCVAWRLRLSANVNSPRLPRPARRQPIDRLAGIDEDRRVACRSFVALDDHVNVWRVEIADAGDIISFWRAASPGIITHRSHRGRRPKFCCLTTTRRKCCYTKFTQTTRRSRSIGTDFNGPPAGRGCGDDRGRHRHRVRPC